MILTRILASALLVLCLVPCSAQAKPNPSDWANVKRLKIGTSLQVSTKKGESFVGVLKHVDDDLLVLLVPVSQSSRMAVELQRDQVTKVSKKKSRGLSMILGTAIGLGVGIGIGAIVDSRSSGEDPGLGKLVFGMLGAASGTGVGGAFSIRGKTVYVAP